MSKTLHDGTVVEDEVPTKSTSLGRFLIEGQELADLDATKAQFVIDRAAEIAAQPLVAYKEVRRAAYPEIGDQLDAIWKGGDDQEAMKVIVDRVKSDNPKP